MTQPTLTREGLAVALFSLLQGIPGVVTCSRRVRHWADVPAEEQPAIFLAKGTELPLQSPDGNPAIWKEEFTIHIYNHQTDPSVAPSTAINSLLDAVESRLKPVASGPPGFPGSMQVLGDLTGRIRHAWISGSIETDEGCLGDQAVAIIPIEIEVI